MAARPASGRENAPPPDDERRPAAHEAPSKGLTTTSTSVRRSTVSRIGPPCGCLHGGPGHECGLEEPVRETCSRRCSALGIDELVARGERAGGCHCSPLRWSA